MPELVLTAKKGKVTFYYHGHNPRAIHQLALELLKKGYEVSIEAYGI